MEDGKFQQKCPHGLQGGPLSRTSKKSDLSGRLPGGRVYKETEAGASSKKALRELKAGGGDSRRKSRPGSSGAGCLGQKRGAGLFFLGTETLEAPYEKT